MDAPADDPVDSAGVEYRWHAEALDLLAAGHAAEARELLGRALARIEAVEGPDHPDVANVRNGLAEALLLLRRDPEAEVQARRAVTIAEGLLSERAAELDADTTVAVETILQEALSNCCTALRGQGRFADAEGPGLKALGRSRRTFGAAHLLTGTRHNNLGVLYKYWGKLDLARRHYDRAREIFRAHADREPLQLATIEYNLGGLAHARGRFAEAETHCRGALERYLELLPQDHTDVAVCRMTLAATLDGQGRFEESEVLYGEARRALEREYGDRHPDVALILHNLGAIALARGRFAEARDLLSQALVRREAALGREHFQVSSTRRLLAAVHEAESNSATGA